MRVRFFAPVILAISVATVSLAGFAQGAGAQPAATESAAEDCLAKPGAAGPPGSHWYYRLDRATKRQCWYLGTAGAKARLGETRQGETRKHASTRSAPAPLAEQDAAEQPAADMPGEAANGQGTSRPSTDPTLPIRAVPVQSLHIQAAPDQGSPAQASPDQALPNQVLSAQAMSSQTAGETAPDQSASVAGRAATPTSNSYAAEQPSENEDDMPLVWPILTPAERAAAGLASGSSVKPGFMLVVLAGALAFAAAIARLLFKLFGTARADPRDRRRVVRDAPPALRPAPPSRVMPGHGKIVRRPPSPLQTGLGAEDDVHALLRDLQRTAA
jgi:hypothetical protein